MFNRGSRDRVEGPISVEITLEDGQALKGTLVVPQGRTLTEVLNGTATFIEFEPIKGQRTFIAKSALRAVKPTNAPPAPDLSADPAEGGDFDPFSILGVEPGSTREQAREAYLRLAKTYHPDRYAATDLPREVRDYLSAMVRRVNAAYEVLEAEKREQAAKAEPVFTKAGQG
jgi:hypothetical protein